MMLEFFDGLTLEDIADTTEIPELSDIAITEREPTNPPIVTDSAANRMWLISLCTCFLLLI